MVWAASKYKKQLGLIWKTPVEGIYNFLCMQPFFLFVATQLNLAYCPLFLKMLYDKRDRLKKAEI